MTVTLPPVPMPVPVPRPAAALAAAAERHCTPCGPGLLQWHCWGTPQAPPVVLLHGGSGSWTHWLRNIEPLLTRYRVLAVDLPGLGDSSLPPDGFDPHALHASVRSLADLVDAGLQALVDRPVQLVGFSLGSIVSAAMAARRPAGLHSLTLVGAAAMGMPWRGLAGKLQATTPDMGESACLAVQRHNLGLLMLHRREHIYDDAAALQLHNVLRARLRTHTLASSDVLRRLLPDLRHAPHVIWGEHDIYALPHRDQRIAVLHQHHPDATVRIIDDAGHWVMYEAATAFNAALAARLEAA